MPTYSRPSLLTANQAEVSAYLLTKAMQSSITKDDTAMLITIAGTDADLTTALVGYVQGAIIAAEQQADAEASAAFGDFTANQLTKIRAVYADPTTSAFTKVQSDKLLAGLALLVHRRLR